jgi:hypothetical protein
MDPADGRLRLIPANVVIRIVAAAAERCKGQQK